MDYRGVYEEVRKYFEEFEKNCINCKYAETDKYVDCLYCDDFSNWDFDIKVLDKIEESYK